MESPTAKLNAYILEHRVKRTLENSPYSSPCRTNSYDHLFRSPYPKTWLHDVLTMPPNLTPVKFRTPSSRKSRTSVPDDHSETSVQRWLNEIDEKIMRRFPNVDKPRNSDSEGSNDTIKLLMADPQTGEIICDCASYDSHPNITEQFQQSANECHCNPAKTPQWVDQVLAAEDSSVDLCESCIEKERREKSPKCCYRPKHLDSSVSLPEGYSLLGQQGKKKRKKPTAAISLKNSGSTPLPSGDRPKTADTPETKKVMELLEHAITQLHEVKMAVEDNTVSAVTNTAGLDSCTTSQALSELPLDETVEQ